MTSAPQPRRGFSLVELMIAIMILGLGMVMVATVFPVSLDMTRGTVQLSISQTVAEAAVGTLALRMPSARDLTPPVYPFAFPTPRVAFPDMYSCELMPPYAHLDVIDLSVRNPVLPPAPTDPRFPRVRFYTEQTFWDAGNVPPGFINQNITFVVPAQNIGPDLQVLAEAPPFPTVGQQTPIGQIRVSAADRVYPPVDLYYPDGTSRLATAIDKQRLLEEVSRRRYLWTAIHFRDINSENDDNKYICRIAVLYRANLSSKYMSQLPASWGGRVPVPANSVNGAGWTNDTLFPQVWRVALDSVNGATGAIVCSPEVAKLLPAGSMFMVCQGSPPGLCAKVVRNNWNGDLSVASTVIQTEPGDLPTGTNVQIWLFPPALAGGPPANRNMANVSLEPASPVVDIVERNIVAE